VNKAGLFFKKSRSGLKEKGSYYYESTERDNLDRHPVITDASARQRKKSNLNKKEK
jgi:hypothetical protein